MTRCGFDFDFIELIMDRIDFVEIDLVKINFKVKWFMLGNLI